MANQEALAALYQQVKLQLPAQGNVIQDQEQQLWEQPQRIQNDLHSPEDSGRLSRRSQPSCVLVRLT